jgi:hypothetical protein
MRTAKKRKTINHYLGHRGLATLDDPGAMIQQLGFLIEGHEEFRRLLNKCAQDERRNMYESLRPHLSFEPKPLDVYIAELALDAEIRQLPVMGPDGMLHEFKVQDIKTAVAEEIGKHHLTVTCRKCTKQASFSGLRKADAIQALRDAGWIYDSFQGGQEICPDCPGAN